MLGNDGVYQITTTDTCSFVMKKNTPILTNYMRKYHNPYAIIIWIGQNGGFTDGEDLCDQIQRMVDYAGTDKYLVINFHTQYFKNFNDILVKRFGKKVLDLYGAVLKIANTEQDIIDVKEGICPSSLRADDGGHLNDVGYKMLGTLLNEKIQELNY